MERETDQKEYSRTYAEINLGAIRHNILEERKRVGSRVKIMAVIKADAYGHGDVPVAEALDDLVDAYGVALAEEALHLRQQGIGKMILILGYTGSGWFEELISHDISQTVYSYPMAKELSEAAVRLGKTAKIHIKVDTGMSRIGFLPVRDNIDVIRAISELPGICLEGIFTHFARADEETSEAAREPFEKFIIFVRELEGRGIHIPLKHAANSASIIHFPEAYLDMVRSGITTYGLYPSELVPKEKLHIRPALQWKSLVSFVKTVHPGTSVGYGGQPGDSRGYGPSRLRGWSQARSVWKRAGFDPRTVCADYWKDLHGPVYGGCDGSVGRLCRRYRYADRYGRRTCDFHRRGGRTGTFF